MRPRSPGFFYGALAAVLVVVLTVFTLTTNQPPPPSIAEFAPQAQETIEEAPSEQSSEFGSGEGEGIGGPGGSPPPEPIDVPRTRRCVGDPPRQIEDPQSPPCVPFWEGDNGGATWRGVTRDEILLYMPDHEEHADINEQLAAFFNKRFEFYGRKIRIIFGSTAGSIDPAAQRGHAADAEASGAFGSGIYRIGAGVHYADESARLGLVTAHSIINHHSSQLQERHPYLYEYKSSVDEIFSGTGAWTCSRLAGRLAQYAEDDDLTLSTQERKFALVIQPWYEDEAFEESDITDELAKCGVEPTITLISPVAKAGGLEVYHYDPSTANNAILQIKASGATSVICLCSGNSVGTLMNAANNQTYHPEWIGTSYGSLDEQAVFTSLGAPPPDQSENFFGLTFLPRHVDPQDESAYHALAEVEPEMTRTWDLTHYWLYIIQYRKMLLYASGIQMAGPNLTPQTFYDGLRRTTFPNPAHRLHPGRVGFNEGEPHTMMLEAAEFWYDPRRPTRYDGSPPGAYCYPNSGKRYGPGTWPTGPEPFFEEPCD